MDGSSATGRGTGHRVFPRASDLLLEAWGTSREECMAEAVNALVDCFADVSSALPGRVVPFVVAAEADERQLHDVLDECLTVFEIFGIVAVGTRIDRAEDGSVAGCIDAADVSQVRLRSAPPIGVRLHELEFDESSGHAWHCLVGVDA